VRSATKQRCTSDVHGPEPVHQKLSTREDRFSASIHHLPVKTVARLSGAKEDAVKSWRSGRRFPQWTYLQRMQQTIPAVRSFVAQEFGFETDGLAALRGALEQSANDSTPEAAVARSLLRSLTK
jgi:hypothetical protein